MCKVILTTIIFGLSLVSLLADDVEKDIKMYPEPASNVERFIVRLEPKENELDYFVELMPGVVYEKGCNAIRMHGSIARKSVKGWGYSYYEVSTNGIMTSTMMACPPNTPKKTEFIYVHDPQNSKVRYNSKIPLVVYMPKNFELKYRIYSPSETKEAKTE